MSAVRRWRQPRQLADALRRVRQQALPPTLLARVQDRWAESVGTRVCEEGTPVAEHDGIVTVSCRSAVWASELTMLSADLLVKLNTGLGEGSQVKGLRFTTRPI